MTSPQARAQADFDPTDFPIVPAKTFEDLKLGDTFRAPGRTLTDAQTTAFQVVSVDNNPRHYNDLYAKALGMKSALIQPLQILGFSAPGATLFTHHVADVLEGFTGTSCKFLKDTFVGDTIYTTLEIVGLEPVDGKGIVTMAVTILNQDGEIVIAGEQTFMLKLSA